MRIGVLTSSRADYGIYLPLLNQLKEDAFFELEVIAFGTHLSKFHGYTVDQIEKDSYSKIHKISSLISNDDEQAISSSYALTALKFADFWANHKFDLVFCLGDRFEMNAAVQAGIPFRVNFIHLYGGDTTLGAIDDIYRHQITLASKIHFTATEEHKEKVKQITGKNEDIYAVGSLSLDEMINYTPIQKDIFYQKYDIPEGDYVLITFHPETIAISQNQQYSQEMKNALESLSKRISLVITMPNADTLGSVYRKELENLQKENLSTVRLIENFGKENYFSAMFYARFLLGNTSSGIVEAASFNKYVINVGDRQKGRAQSKNTFNVKFDSTEIFQQSIEVLNLEKYDGENIYYRENVAQSIIQIIKEHA